MTHPAVSDRIGLDADNGRRRQSALRQLQQAEGARCRPFARPADNDAPGNAFALQGVAGFIYDTRRLVDAQIEGDPVRGDQRFTSCKANDKPVSLEFQAH